MTFYKSFELLFYQVNWYTFSLNIYVLQMLVIKSGGDLVINHFLMWANPEFFQTHLHFCMVGLIYFTLPYVQIFIKHKILIFIITLLYRSLMIVLTRPFKWTLDQLLYVTNNLHPSYNCVLWHNLKKYFPL